MMSLVEDTLLIRDVGCFRVDSGVLLLRSNKPLNHWPFRQQAAKHPVVSPKVTDGGTGKKVSLFRGLWFLELVSLLHIY